MSKVGLINIANIKQRTLLNSNVDDKILVRALAEVQDLELEPLIGSTYLNKLEDGKANDTLSDEDKLVITDVIQPFLVYGTLVYSLTPLHYKLGAKGLATSTDATLKMSTESELNSFSTHYKQKFEAYKKRLIDYFKTDDNDETNTPHDESTTTSILNFYMPDNIDRSREYAKARANKMNF